MRAWFVGLACYACTTRAVPVATESTAVADDPEIAAPGFAPIIPNEPERSGYRPRFDPGLVAFDSHNRPYFHVHRRTATSSCPAARDGWFDEDLIQTLNEHGRWVTVDLAAQARATLPAIDGARWNGCYRSGREYDERIVFDRAGAAYTYIAATQSNVPFGILAYSRDGGATWVGYWMKNSVQSVTGADSSAGWQATLEFQDGNNVIDGPPNILIHGFFGEWGSNLVPRDLYLQIPVKSGPGLSFPPPIKVTTTSNALVATEHSGAANKVVRSQGNRAHIVFAATTAPAGVSCAGTPVYARTYDRATRAFANQPVFVGCSGLDDHGVAGPDNHDSPGIAIDSRGTLHVVFGAHQGSLQYVKSVQPDSTAAWTAPVTIGEPKQPRGGGYTYVSLLCDRRDTLHVVARYAGLGYVFRLAYLRMSSTGEWASFPVNPRDPIARPELVLRHQHLVIPSSVGYAVYHHKLDLDRRGTLYLSYETWPQQFSDGEATAYCDRFPEDRFSSRAQPSCERGTLRKDCSACRTTGPLIPFHEPGRRPNNASCTYCDTPGGCPPPPYCDYMIASNPHVPSILMSQDNGGTWRLATTRDFMGR